ncbi:MAG: hypothetical protein A2Z25_14985 [Planctomycetes bacterium RBG_16_55_9]|nr:MAG: hypothetical protein A2Z25_14985 [Planctomycetes bacterium RBG_16_55_9]
MYSVKPFIIQFMVGKSNKNAKRKRISRQADPIQEAIDYGIDVSALAGNLQRSVTERVRRHQIALNTVKKLRKEKTTSTEDFDNLFERLVDNGVDFVVVGDFAGVVYGCTYVNQGIEICCDFSAANLLAMQEALSDLDPVHRMTPKRQKLKLTRETCTHFKNLYLDTRQGQLDCLSFIDGLGDFRQAKEESELIEIEDTKVRVLSLDALIKTKRAMNRPRDKLVIAQLEGVRRLREEKS